MKKDENLKDTIAIIGSNDFQNQLILKAKSMGLETHVFAWKCGDVGEQTADFFYPISITEKDKILDVCKKIQPVGIVSIGSDLASITVNYIAEKMGLVGNSTKSSVLSTNKHEMRMAFERAALPSPKSILLEDNKWERIAALKFPLIIKPTDRSGSRGIYKVNSKQEMDRAIERARKESFEKKVLVEEFVEGKEYSVESISYQGEHRILAITEKFTTGAPKFIEVGHMEPADISVDLGNKVEKLVEGALTALDITCGAAHSEIKIDKFGNIKLIEVGGRMGGDCIGSDLVPLSTGYDFVRMVIDIACGKKPDLLPRTTKRYAFVRFIFSNKDLEVLDWIKEQNTCSINRISAILPENERYAIEDSSARWGYYIISAENKIELKNIVERINGYAIL